MIIVKLNGGLGNQMFQYAFGRRLTIDRKTELGLDVSGYKDDPKRHYSLDAFSIRARLVTDEEVANAHFRYGFFSKTADLWRKKIRQQFYEGFDEKLLSLSDGAYLDGFFQSEKCFKSIEGLLHQEFALARPLKNAANAVQLKIMATRCPISVHIRRGDYVSEPRFKKYYAAIDPDYYQRASEYVVKSSGYDPLPKLFVFSDDIKWAKGNIRFSFPTEFVSNGEIEDYEEMFLMSTCHHHIIANSSFSWWGAWLDNKPGKIVVAPRFWFASRKKDEDDIIPAEWIRL